MFVTHSRMLFVLCVLSFCVAPGFAQKKRKIFIPGQPAIVFDDRLSALRAEPDVKARLQQRLSRGRAVGVLVATKNKSGSSFLRVAVSRNVRGWILTAAIARLNSVADGEKVLAALAAAKDDLIKIRMARVCADSLRLPAIAPRALLALGQAAEHAAEKLSRDADRRLGENTPDTGVSKRDFELSFNGLDQFNRAGVTFDYDEAQDRFAYDGAAYRELLRRYPRSAEAAQARERLKAMGKAL